MILLTIMMKMIYLMLLLMKKTSTKVCIQMNLFSHTMPQMILDSYLYFLMIIQAMLLKQVKMRKQTK